MEPLLPEYHFELPDALIAREPPARRDGGRLMVLDPSGTSHRRIVDLPALLSPGDLLVVNDTRVLHARVKARRASGGAVEVLFLEPGPGPVQALLRPARRLRPGEQLAVEGGGEITLLDLDAAEGIWRVRTRPEPLALMAGAGEPPLPPYLGREARAEDAARYQTVYAREPGAVAAPTAGLHLSAELLARLAERGVGVAAITLHVGIGTFRPLRREDLERGRLHGERFEVSSEVAEAVADRRARGGRVIAVGTTACRALEAAAARGRVEATSGVTDLFIREGHRFVAVDGLLTNFHLPGSSLIMLVSALAGRERVLAAYAEAVRERYRFYSYGDAMLIL